MPDNRRRSLPLSPALLALLAAVAACSGGGQAQPGPGARGRGGPTPVAVATVERRDLAREITLAGSVEPLRLVAVNSRAAGTILTVRVAEGDRVRPGTLLAELDPRETAAQLARARAVLANAKTAFERAERMRTAEILTEAEFEQARAAHATALSDVDLWETRLEFTRVLAPTSGVVTAKLVEAGSAVTANQKLFDVADDSLLVVRVQMSELDVVHVEPRAPVGVQLDAHPGAVLSGWVRRVFPSAEGQTRLIPVEVALRAAPPGVTVRPGFLARVRFDLERRADAVVVPAAAVGAGGAGAFAFVVENDSLVRRPIETGVTLAGQVEVLRGLAPGERVVTSGLVNLRAGMAVRVAAGMTGIADSAAGQEVTP